MIIRAVSDSESDEERGSVFGAGSHSTFPSARDGAGAGVGSVARRVWIAVCVAIVGLVLADVAALAGLLTRAPSPISVCDEFALVPMALAAAFPVSGAVSTARAVPASALNHWVGLALVAAWIFSREAPTPGRRAWWWIGAVSGFGHAASCVYVLGALLESDGDRVKFWAGAKKRRPGYEP